MPEAQDRALDVICLGRAAVDLYGQQVGGRLEDMRSFAKYLGGSSANLAAGAARMGLRSAMLARVGDEQMGRFVREALATEGVDVSHVTTDPDRLTALVILGIGAGEDVPHIFYRERCADMGLVEDDIDPDFIGSSRMLSVTGTHLSTATTRAAVVKAMTCARERGTQVTLDIDYRPVLWGLVSAGDGASRYAECAEASAVLADILPLCDLVVGTEEEIRIAAGGEDDLLASVQRVRALSDGWIVLKRGPDGCVVFAPGDIGSLDDGIVAQGTPVEVFNTLGAGDAFLSGFLGGWLTGESPATCGAMGNASGALVVARHGCTPAIPSRVELDAFLRRDPPPRVPRLDPELIRLHRSTTWKDDPKPLCVMAFDHRSQFIDMANEAGQPHARIDRFKTLIAEAALDVAAGLPDDVRGGFIVDQRFGGEAMDRLSAAGLWTACPVETPGSRPLAFEHGHGMGQQLLGLPPLNVIKCLVFYHPDDPLELRLAQEERVQALYSEICAQDRKLVLEVICPSTGAPVDDDTLPRAMRRFYNLGVFPDWWKVESQSAAGWRAVASVIDDCDPHCKGIVLLGLDASEDALREGFASAAGVPYMKGFAVGRSIFGAPARAWFAGEMDDAAARADVARRYRRMVDIWRQAAMGGAVS
ncbi:5-dehydro-2-deoxygluconokinase [Marinihelvus fidelis]|uniref:5-dehydro-2-deoxygluconokinase n=1 Tax=Marinihelvus fidelis TaxID=2613842 RepID=A0A5N0TE92_9GAMM|nr:5-dehydro-2-deoxygluconokinase [Marinihelvus fidelis]KAA9131619.1 5-dehydro-2-deoxygluconokinase [Marinihelvus fidelis]